MRSDFFREFRPRVCQTASGLWSVLVLGFGFCLVLLFGLGLLVFFSPHHVVFPSSSMMIWALRPHGVRTRGKKIGKLTCQMRQHTVNTNLQLSAKYTWKAPGLQC